MDLNEFLAAEGVTLPSISDVMLGLSVSEKHAQSISKCITEVFSGKFVTLSSFDNGCHRRFTVESTCDNTVMQVTIGEGTTVNIIMEGKPLIHRTINTTGVVTMRKMLKDVRESYVRCK